jgi:hypothetical protein
VVDASGYVAQAGAAGVLGAAGLLKLAKPASLDQALEALGVPEGGRRPLALGVAVLEVALAVLLLTRQGAVAAVPAALFVGLVLGTLLVLRRRAPAVPCGCLGEFSSSDQSSSLFRNLLLLGLLAVGLIAPSAPSALGALVGFQLSILVVVVPAGTWTLLQLHALRNELEAS